jgi:hypothetical protein
VRQLNCGAIEAIQDPGDKPTCKLVPRVTLSGGVELVWDTRQARTAFISNGVGHVLLGEGARSITPTESTEYNMTVVSDTGLVGVCSARVEVAQVDTDPAGLSTVTPPEVDITVQGDTTTGLSDPLLTLIKAWWWLIGITLFVIYFIHNRIKQSLGI